LRRDRRFIGGSDARIIMGQDEPNLVRMWQGEARRNRARGPFREPHCPAGDGHRGPEPRWYERNTGNAIRGVQRHIQHPVHKWMAATLDGLAEPSGAVFEAKFMLRAFEAARRATAVL
jgi:hypothetical protein